MTQRSKTVTRLVPLILVGALGAGLAGCDSEAENALEDAADSVGDAVHDAGDAAKDAVNDAADNIEDATDGLD